MMQSQRDSPKEPGMVEHFLGGGGGDEAGSKGSRLLAHSSDSIDSDIILEM